MVHMIISQDSVKILIQAIDLILIQGHLTHLYQIQEVQLIIKDKNPQHSEPDLNLLRKI